MSLNATSNINVDFIVEQFELATKVLEFLKKKEFLPILEQNCQKLINRNHHGEPRSFDPLFFNLNLRFSEIEEADILCLITEEPKQFVSLVEEVIFCFLTSSLEHSGNNALLVREQIHCNVRFYELPLIPIYKFTLKTVHINCALTTFHCVVFSKTIAGQYIRQSVWKCEKCFGLAPVIHKNRVSDKKSVNCEVCRSDCIEILHHRETSKFCSVQVFDVDFKALSIASSIKVKLYDDICQDLKLGNKYIVIGVYEPFQDCYIAWSIISAAAK